MVVGMLKTEIFLKIKLLKLFLYVEMTKFVMK